MRYPETLQYLYNKLPMFTRDGASAYKNNLDNTIALCAALGNPHHSFKSIHVAGTNGKGSCSHMLSSIMQEAGYKTGLYTSPHLKDFRERIKVNGQCVSEQWVIDFVDQHRSLIEKIQPSFFEITVAMAFLYFKEQNLDIAIIEVGMGGLLDSTNVISPELCVITNIGLDHTQFLGNTYAEIAANKAGIIKHKVPVVIGETHPLTEKVFLDTALSKQAQIYFADKVYDCIKSGPIDSETTQASQQYKLVNKSVLQITTIHCDLLGQYQHKNICTVLMAVEMLQHQGWQINTDIVVRALNNVKGNTGLQGRFDIIHRKPTCIIDVAHNTDGIRILLEQISTILEEKHLTMQNLHIVCGFVKDKNIYGILGLLPQQAHYYFTQAPIPRALSYEALQIEAKQFGLAGTAYATVKEAYDAAKQNAAENELVLVCGSFFIVCELL